MSQLLENVRQVLTQLLPAYIINDVKCFVFHDNHPKCDKNIDITVYTKLGEVREYYQRDLLSYVNLETLLHSEIRIMRNSRGDLYYLLTGGDELTILSRRDELEVHQRITEVTSYEVSDAPCSGEALLQVVCRNNEIPIVPDDNFENFEPIGFALPTGPFMQGPLITHLTRKLTAAKFSVKNNEKSIKDCLEIRQQVAFSIYRKIHPNLDESIFKDGLENIANVFKIHTRKPWIKTANKKIVIVHNVSNGNEEPLEEIQIFLHGTVSDSIEYSTKIFQETSSPPFWNEIQSQTLAPTTESAIVLVIDLEELKDSIINRIELNGVIIYRKNGKEGLIPIDNITLSSLDTMGEEFDAMSSDLTDPNVMLAVLATTEKTDLIFRHIKQSNEPTVTIDTFCEYLKMVRVPNANNIAIHKSSPYHVLNGVMIIFDTEKRERSERVTVSVHSRSTSQIIALIHLIQDAIPFRIVITTPSYKVTSKSDIFSSYNETIAGDPERVCNYMDYATSMLNRTRLVLEYLDNSMIKMSESKNPLVLNEIGNGIDLFAQGESSYQEFKKLMREEAAEGVKILEKNAVVAARALEMSLE